MRSLTAKFFQILMYSGVSSDFLQAGVIVPVSEVILRMKFFAGEQGGLKRFISYMQFDARKNPNLYQVFG